MPTDRSLSRSKARNNFLEKRTPLPWPLIKVKKTNPYPDNANRKTPLSFRFSSCWLSLSLLIKMCFFLKLRNALRHISAGLPSRSFCLFGMRIPMRLMDCKLSLGHEIVHKDGNEANGDFYFT